MATGTDATTSADNWRQPEASIVPELHREPLYAERPVVFDGDQPSNPVFA